MNQRGFSCMRSFFVFLASIAIASACTPTNPAPPPPLKVVHDPVTVRDPDLDKRVSRLELQLLARDAQIEDLQTRLEDTRAEGVRAMGKLQWCGRAREAA